MISVPRREGHIWAADFTYLPFKKWFVYLATVMDIFTREVIGWTMMGNHGVALVLQALFGALEHHGRPEIFHSDNGEGVRIEGVHAGGRGRGDTDFPDRSGVPRENAFQESFFSQFKIDLGDPQRFATLGELVYAAGRTIWEYNHARIHLALKMPPQRFAELHKNLVENYSKERGA